MRLDDAGNAIDLMNDRDIAVTGLVQAFLDDRGADGVFIYNQNCQIGFCHCHPQSMALGEQAAKFPVAINVVHGNEVGRPGEMVVVIPQAAGIMRMKGGYGAKDIPFLTLRGRSNPHAMPSSAQVSTD
ncbi:hypothetical protein [Rhizobium sp. ZW T2_16]|uniref:hypothetical protein n=2 Tax=Rhizobium/Agrobacterium group TaxID=227290 RepID=UPI003851A04C